MSNYQLSKEEKELFKLIKNSFKNISDRDTLGFMTIIKEFIDIGEIYTMPDEELRVAIERVKGVI